MNKFHDIYCYSNLNVIVAMLFNLISFRIYKYFLFITLNWLY